ncbi:Met-10+ like-protein-domain-containing protein [Flagelloscypha sp. PMI_526]|nr:Met-10+ like-protein-domain-containing protein [Flagelloscypha sp. PMI_526]
MPLNVSPPVWFGTPGVLDKTAFRTNITVLSAEIPAKKTGSILKAESLRGVLLDLPKVKTVLPHPINPETHRLLLLRYNDLAELPGSATEYFEREDLQLTTHMIQFDYDYWTADDILGTILPEHLRDEAPSGFAVAGHIAHLNLNDEYLPYKETIGQIILDKNPNIRTVVNKLDTIDNKFRFFKMEILAGDQDFIVHHSESDCRFTFDFSKVYWNSRLHMEHARLVSQFSPQSVVADVFAGVGPFAVPAGRKGTCVLANDLNPDSYLWLQHNIKDNNVENAVRPFCEDGREFIAKIPDKLFNEPLPGYTQPQSISKKRKIERSARNAGAPLLPEAPVPPRNRIDHFVMNLPDSAITFLDAFRGIFSAPHLREMYTVMPQVHCYCFTRELEEEKARADVIQRCEKQLGHALPSQVALHLVRSVAPNKHMYCISFQLPFEVATA